MGSGLMVRKKPLEVMVKSMAEIMSRPLTVKIRTGIYMDKRIGELCELVKYQSQSEVIKVML